MIPGQASFRNRALAGYLSAILPLSAAMAVTVACLNDREAHEVASLRREEDEIGLARQLRSSAQLLASAGRGYLISGAAELLTRVRKHELEFDQGVRAFEGRTLSRDGAALVEDAQRAAREFRRVQADLLVDRRQGEQLAQLAVRFDAELLPQGALLGRVLDRLIGHKERALDESYDQAARARIDLVTWTYVLLGTVTGVSLSLGWYFATRLARAYRKEQEAVGSARDALSQRDELMGILAHDLRNPLHAISLKASLLRQQAGSERMESQADSIGKITATMAELVDSMLELSTIQSGRCSIKPVPQDAGSLLDDALEMYSHLAAAKEIRLERPLMRGKLLVLADRERVLQVLSNLLGNAVKATPCKGVIGASAEPDGDMIRFRVWDSGSGIAREHLPHIFERRWKCDIAGTKGTGLGLFIAKSIVDAHGGRIWGESSERGALFGFTLPRAEVRHSPLRAGEGVGARVSL
ncbi:MAG: HAMP domain-containing sensor histidine kinase [Deltaproteobacteria bacterium]